MHLAMHNWMRAEPLRSTLRRIVRHGYSSIEFTPESNGPRAEEVKRLLADIGVQCCGVVAPPAEFSLVSQDPRQRSAAARTAVGYLSLAAQLGGTELTIVPAVIGQLESSASAADEWRWAIDGLTEICEHAHKLGVRVAVEPLNRFETYFINRADQALALADQVGPMCGVCLDTFHMNIEEHDPVAAILNAGNRLYGFHLADSNRLGCGMGHLDWPAIVSALRQIEYRGALTLECLPQPDRTATTALRDRRPSSDPVPAAMLSRCMSATAQTLNPLLHPAQPLVGESRCLVTAHTTRRGARPINKCIRRNGDEDDQSFA
jgi:sugar phosphate isomerase/epimerase